MATNIELIKIAFKQHNEGDLITFRIQPDDSGKGLEKLKLGERITCHCMKLNDDETLSELET